MDRSTLDMMRFIEQHKRAVAMRSVAAHMAHRASTMCALAEQLQIDVLAILGRSAPALE